MKTTLFLAFVGVAALGITLWPGTSSPHIAAGDAKRKQGVDLPDDALLQAIQKRFGKPDSVSGSGRMFIHYNLQNGDILTLAVSGRKVIGANYENTPDAPKENDPRDTITHLREVAAGMFERWQKEAEKNPSNVTYTRIEYDKKTFWVVDVHLGFWNAYKTIAVYAPVKEGSFQRCLLADSNRAGNFGVTVDAKTGMLELREKANTNIKGEVVLSCNLKTIGTAFSSGVVRSDQPR